MKPSPEDRYLVRTREAQVLCGWDGLVSYLVDLLVAVSHSWQCVYSSFFEIHALAIESFLLGPYTTGMDLQSTENFCQ